MSDQRPDVVPPHDHSLDDLPVGFGPGKIPPQATVLKLRVLLADLPAALTTGPLLMGSIPANQVVDSAFLFVNDAPVGGGVSTCEATVGASAPPGANYIETGQLFGFASPSYFTRYTGPDPADFELIANDVHHVDRSAFVVFTADVNLDTLTNFDVTAYVVLSPVKLSAP